MTSGSSLFLRCETYREGEVQRSLDFGLVTLIDRVFGVDTGIHGETDVALVARDLEHSMYK